MLFRLRKTQPFYQPKILGVPRNLAFGLCAIFFQLDKYSETIYFQSDYFYLGMEIGRKVVYRGVYGNRPRSIFGFR